MMGKRGLPSASGMKGSPEVPVGVSWAQVVLVWEGKGLRAGSFGMGRGSREEQGPPS